MNLAEIISLYVSHKRSLGYRFRSEGAILLSFSRMMGDVFIENVNAEKVLDFLNGTGSITETWRKKYHSLSGFYRFAIAREFVKSSPLPHSIPRMTVPDFVPYIYTHHELKRLLEATPAACTKRTPIQQDVLHTLILLIYGAGLRLGEALALTLNEVDLERAYLLIRETKFFKSRLVPLGKDLTKIVADYIYRNHISEITTPLFSFRNGSPLSQSAVRNAFRRLRLSAGVMRDGGARRQPRIHDLRHTAAVHRLIAWYRNGVDLQNLLPKLATYLGHVNLSSTQRYLTITPELLNEASKRFENYTTGETNHE